jgi:hypothetical protein
MAAWPKIGYQLVTVQVSILKDIVMFQKIFSTLEMWVPKCCFDGTDLLQKVSLRQGSNKERKKPPWDLILLNKSSLHADFLLVPVQFDGRMSHAI